MVDAPAHRHAISLPLSRGAMARRRWRAWAIVSGAVVASFVSAGLVVGSLALATGAVVLAAASVVKRHALIPPALESPALGLDLGPLGFGSVLPDRMLQVGPAPENATARTPDLGDGSSVQSVIASTEDPLAGPLAGPKVAAQVHTTLVRRDIDGVLVRPDPNPAEAALRLVSLDEGSRRAVNAVLNLRGQALDHAVIINLPFIIIVQSGQAGGNKPVVLGATAIALARTDAFFAFDDLESLIAGVLPASQRLHYQALLHDYWHAYAIDEARARAARRQDPAPESLLISEGKLKLLGEEAGRSFERVLRSGDLLHYWFSRHLALNPAQAGPFRDAIAAYAQQHGGDGDKATKLELLETLRRGLNPTQRRTLERNMKGFLD